MPSIPILASKKKIFKFFLFVRLWEARGRIIGGRRTRIPEKKRREL